MLGSPKADHLLTLVKFNVFRAMMTFFYFWFDKMECMQDEAVSPFSTMNPGRLDPSLPQSLRPIILQRTIPHHPWLDMFLIPTIGDDLVRAGDLFDYVQLCIDIMKFCRASPERIVTEAFVKNWGWVIKGCHEIFESTNYWRAQRGEEPLYHDSGIKIV
ncbi:hypothetical protein POJ06DRAFT_283767 [Lipomyces tetrasporus]|uniref:Uncharacterized protein n=1 Tax=Lipomyces tetrasporus TaxID=54092 RepID=A0AAD7QL81_9ASCO|nr:uncharacterized protein POJ06DRAFT_283767 [Lipomyces tetrasporus]KAJ8097169.1 hypothetical protein POJ06DRAFT_283767 [Lipomyces tetrasporus]